MIPTFQLPRLNSTDLILFIHVVLLVFVQIVFFSFNFIPEVQNFKKLLIKRTILFLPEVFFRVPVLHKIFEIILIAILSQVCNWCITLLLFMIKNILFYKRNKVERGYKIDKPFSDKEDVIAFSDGTVKINTKVNKENIKTRLQSTIVYKKRKKAKNENFLRKPYQIRMKIKLLMGRIAPVLLACALNCGGVYIFRTPANLECFPYPAYLMFLTSIFYLLWNIPLNPYPSCFRDLVFPASLAVEFSVSCLLIEIAMTDFWCALQTKFVTFLPTIPDQIGDALNAIGLDCSAITDALEFLKTDEAQTVTAYVLSTFFLVSILHATRVVDFRLIRCGLDVFVLDITKRTKRLLKSFVCFKANRCTPSFKCPPKRKKSSSCSDDWTAETDSIDSESLSQYLSNRCWLGFMEGDEKKESELIMTLKRAVLATNREQYDKAEQLLHLALRLAQQQQNEQGITYCYDLMANLAFNRFELDKSEKLFISVCQRLLGAGLPQDDLKVIHISLKLARICHLKGEDEKADIGYNWCLDKIQEKKNANVDSKMLYGIINDWYAQFLLDKNNVTGSLKHLQEAYNVCSITNGAVREQSMLLLNDLGITHWRAGNMDSATNCLKEAVSIGNSLDDKTHVGVINANLGLIYLQKGIIKEAEKFCKNALKLGNRHENEESISQANYCFEQIKMNTTP
ncbi:hypothetical protein FQR65_LT01209 [Abscondita terminalis]|nr:hypothetical protein FQR65_LT01209 [Abscondita terminalis]